jgi:hypothetical protein
MAAVVDEGVTLAATVIPCPYCGLPLAGTVCTTAMEVEMRNLPDPKSTIAGAVVLAAVLFRV